MDTVTSPCKEVPCSTLLAIIMMDMVSRKGGTPRLILSNEALATCYI